MSYVLIILILVAVYLSYLIKIKLKCISHYLYSCMSFILKFEDIRLEGYFINTQSGNEIPILNWNAAMLENKHTVSLQDLFSLFGVNEMASEAAKIRFAAGEGRSLVFRHMTNCIVTVGSRRIPKGKKEVLRYNENIFIVSEDRITEMQIRCRQAKPTVVKM